MKFRYIPVCVGALRAEAALSSVTSIFTFIAKRERRGGRTQLSFPTLISDLHCHFGIKYHIFAHSLWFYSWKSWEDSSKKNLLLRDIILTWIQLMYCSTYCENNCIISCTCSHVLIYCMYCLKCQIVRADKETRPYTHTDCETYWHTESFNFTGIFFSCEVENPKWAICLNSWSDLKKITEYWLFILLEQQ